MNCHGINFRSATLRNNTGTVDMQAYLAWLRKNGYGFAGAN